jgi:hypothetical protein
MPERANARARRALALELRLSGMRQQDIAEQIGVGQPRVSRMIKQALAEREAAGVDRLRAVEYERLERLNRAFWAPAVKGDASAAHVVLKASDRRGKLMGLDVAPEPATGGGGVQSYQAMVLVTLSDEANTALAAWRLEQQEYVDWCAEHNGGDVIAEQLMTPPPGMEPQQAAAAAVRQLIGPRPPDAPKLLMAVVVIAQEAMPRERNPGGRLPLPGGSADGI